MRKRLTQLGAAMVVFGLIGFAIAGYTAVRTMDGMNSLSKFSAAQAVGLSYNEAGELTDHGTVEGAQKIWKLVSEDWGYRLDRSELDPKDPVVNTASEYMFQLGAISEHTLYGATTVVLAEDVKDKDGKVIKPAGSYKFENSGKYYSQFDRTDPIEGAARGQLWSGTALGLIAQLGVGAVTASTLQIGLGLVGVIGGLAGILFFLGLGLIWAMRAKTE